VRAKTGGGGESGDANGAGAGGEDEKVRVPEYLQLSLEEAFFLTFAIGALSVKDRITGEVRYSLPSLAANTP
jgi:hypothetical protein